MKSKSHDHYANQQKAPGMKPSAPSPSTVKKVGITPPISKPSPSTVKKPSITPPKC